MSAIWIPRAGSSLAGLLFEPDFSGRKAPGIVVIHPRGEGRGEEQAVRTYARRLSEKGYVTLSYDTSLHGRSEGSIALREDPMARVTDVSAVVDYLQKLKEVDASKVLAVGIGEGGGYAVAAAKGDHRIRAVAVINAINIGDDARLGRFGDADPSQQTAALAQVALAMQAEVQGEPTISARRASEQLGDRTALDREQGHEYRSAISAQHAQNRMSLRSVPLILQFDAWSFADSYLVQPTLLIVAEKAESRWHSEKLHEKIRWRNNNVKKIAVPDGRDTGFYDDDDYVNLAIDEIDSYFKHFGY